MYVCMLYMYICMLVCLFVSGAFILEASVHEWLVIWRQARCLGNSANTYKPTINRRFCKLHVKIHNNCSLVSYAWFVLLILHNLMKRTISDFRFSISNILCTLLCVRVFINIHIISSISFKCYAMKNIFFIDPHL